MSASKSFWNYSNKRATINDKKLYRPSSGNKTTYKTTKQNKDETMNKEQEGV